MKNIAIMAQHSTVRQLIAEGAKTSSPITIFMDVKQ